MMGRRKMPYDFRSFIKLLEEENKLVRVKREVDPKYELGAVLWRAEEQGKAVFFEKVKGKNIPVVGGLYQQIGRLGLALGFKEEEFGYKDFFELVNSAISKPTPPTEVGSGPVKEVVETGDDVDLEKLPVPTFFESDGGPYITAGVSIAKNPETNVLNLGVYRTQVHGKKEITVYGSAISNLGNIYKNIEEKGYESMDLAVAIGVDPVILASAVSKAPPNLSEFDVAGSLNGEPIKVVKGETVELTIPSNTEIVLEGKVNVKNKVSEGPIGEFSGYYGSSTSSIITITAVCHRENPWFQTILGGPAKEHYALINIINTMLNQTILEGLKSKFESVKDANLVWAPSTGTMLKLVISMDKKNEREPREVIKTAFNLSAGLLPVNAFVKQIIVVDEDVDIRNPEDVEWATFSRLPDRSRMVIIPNVAAWRFECVTKPNGTSVRIGMDVTKPLKDREKFKRAKIPRLEKIKLEDYTS